MPRSGALRERVVKFDSIKPDGLSDRELLEAAVHGVNRVHECVHSFRSEQEGVNSHLTKSIGDLKTQQNITDGRVTTLAKAFGAEELKPGEKPVKLKGIGGWSGWKALATLMMSLSGIVLAYKITEPLLEPLFRAIHVAIMAAP